MKNDDRMHLRLPSSLKSEFFAACEKAGISASDALVGLCELATEHLKTYGNLESITIERKGQSVKWDFLWACFKGAKTVDELHTVITAVLLPDGGRLGWDDTYAGSGPLSKVRICAKRMYQRIRTGKKYNFG